MSFGLEGQEQSSSELIPPSSSSTDAVSADSQSVTYPSVFPSVDVRYEMLMGGVKEAIVLNQALTPSVAIVSVLGMGLTWFDGHPRSGV